MLPVDDNVLIRMEEQLNHIYRYIFGTDKVEPPKKSLTRQQRIKAEIQQAIEEEQRALIRPLNR